MARRTAARLTKTSRTLGVSPSTDSEGVGASSGETQGAFAAGLDGSFEGGFSFAGGSAWRSGRCCGCFRRAGVHEEVDVALAVAELGVFEAVVFVGQGEHGLGEEGDGGVVADFGYVDGELAGAGAEEMAADADVVAEVEELVEGEGVFADVVLADVDLEALAALLELREAGLALDADGHDAAGDRDLDGMGRGFELFGGEAVVGGAQLGDGVGGRVAVGVGRFGVAETFGLTEGGDLLELVAALLVEIFFELGLVHEGSFGVS